MKILYTENENIDYQNYQFPYTVHCIKERKDSYSQIYSCGFLPYTNDTTCEEEIYYLARSIRIELSEKLWNYKQRNILNKIGKIYDNANLEITLYEKSLYINNLDFSTWCLQNAKDNFLTEKRLDYILSRPYLKKIMTITHEGKTLAHLLIVEDKHDFFHVWYSFYDLKLAVNDFGKWILLQVINWCKNTGYKHFYIGTCYSSNALYKLSLSQSTYFFNGTKWNNDISGLKKKLLAGNT